MDSEKVKEIINDFESEDFISAKEKLKDEVIKNKR